MKIRISTILQYLKRSHEEQIVTRTLRGEGQSESPPSTFDTIYPIDTKFITYNKLHVYFQLSKTK